MPNTASHIDWILHTGRMLDMEALTHGLGDRLLADGLPLMRLRFGIRTTHPLTGAISVIWEARSAPQKRQSAPLGYEARSTYIGSPMEIIANTRAPYRKRLSDPLTEADHLVLHELKDQGATDYYGMPVPFLRGNGGMFIAVSDGPDGFADADIEALDRIGDVMTLVAEAHSNRHLAEAIATSYLGARTGQRVLDGQITRGDIQTIEAAILFSDIRGWTALNATHPATETLHIANRYFEVMSDAVDDNGGEILKFMGDGVLALFPTGDSGATACANAIAAANTAQAMAETADLEARFGIGIHYGQVLYGNIGARSRIDFTVLGQSVNIAARIEACCGALDAPVLMSDTVAQLCGAPTRRVATQTLKGVDHPMDLHAPASF
ncbi:adenylate/guanylate cyclase domain-containing protein [uncultured Tateyamaria sp.]|uniref:adenylate/guanylate cyclase domain-containing protein n=1 Tax=uncultured Tateyamaria sp. TaxID=455651 RepID=UPI0026089684|nr:adenylate/guanylate cyclase domain-containing protein [uncultured Tateyamaria sp.]